MEGQFADFPMKSTSQAVSARRCNGKERRRYRFLAAPTRPAPAVATPDRFSPSPARRRETDRFPAMAVLSPAGIG
jgi:hypothetical protein